MNYSKHKRSMGSLVLAMSFVLATGTLCPASVLLSFDDDIVHGGTISYDGSGGPLIGSDILFDRVTGVGTPLNNGDQLTIINGKLNFTSGANVTEGPVWTFSGGGSFTLTGTVMDGATTVAMGTLLSGSFSTVSVSGALGTLILVGVGIDTKHPGLLDHFGIEAEEFTFANTEIAMSSVTVGTNGSFSGSVTNADLDNSPIVPEATSLLVWGCLMGITALSLGRRARAA
jgi:hypothetical protein